MDQKRLKIAVFDSGLGGLSVLKALMQLLPYEEFLYLADTANLPYGSKSRAKIVQYTRQNCQFLLSQGVKLIVMACNTATATSLEEVQKEIPIPLVGVIDPVIPHITATSSEKIGILATRATIQSGVYQAKIKMHSPHSHIMAIAAPLLVHLIEEGFVSHTLTTMALSEYLEPLIRAECEAVILGCTHFPLIKEQIKPFFPEGTRIIDPSFACAHEVKKVLYHLDLLSLEQRETAPVFYATDNPERFQYQSKVFLEEIPMQVRSYEPVEASSSPLHEVTLLSP
ncbi:MAG: glutamate racemase [Candidatus Rhabdochlamydia sp.]